MPSVSAMLDQNIFGMGMTLKGEKRNGVLGLARTKLPENSSAWLCQQYDCLPTISDLAHQRKLTLYRYIELHFEDWLRPGSAFSQSLGNLFPKELLSDVHAAVDRSYIFQSDMGMHLARESVIKFCKWLNNKELEKSLPLSPVAKRMPEYMISNITNLKRYREICFGLGDVQLPDALHLWSAEIAGLDYFLTTDKKFINVMTKSNKIELKCQPICPADLLSIMDVVDRSEFQYKENEFYSIAGTRMYV